MTLRTLAVATVATAAMVATLALAACSGGDGDPTANPSPSGSSNRQAAIELANCMRANGSPDFPDPVQDDQGRWAFPPESAGDWEPPEACRPLVHDWKIAFSDGGAVPAEDMTKFRDYAACMRRQGLEDFPDPEPDGGFDLPERIQTLVDTSDPAFATAQRACENLLPPKDSGKGGD
jgi:hypothetical protein